MTVFRVVQWYVYTYIYIGTGWEWYEELLRHLFILLFTFVASEINEKNERQNLESYAEYAGQQGMSTVFCIYICALGVFILHVLVFGVSPSKPHLGRCMAGSAMMVGGRSSN